MKLSRSTKERFDKVLNDKKTSIDSEKTKFTRKEFVELKSYAIAKKIKRKRYVRN